MRLCWLLSEDNSCSSIFLHPLAAECIVLRGQDVAVLPGNNIRTRKCLRGKTMAWNRSKLTARVTHTDPTLQRVNGIRVSGRVRSRLQCQGRKRGNARWLIDTTPEKLMFHKQSAIHQKSILRSGGLYQELPREYIAQFSHPCCRPGNREKLRYRIGIQLDCRS